MKLCERHNSVFDKFYPHLAVKCENDNTTTDEEFNADDDMCEKLKCNANLADHISVFDEYLKKKRN